MGLWWGCGGVEGWRGGGVVGYAWVVGGGVRVGRKRPTSCFDIFTSVRKVSPPPPPHPPLALALLLALALASLALKAIPLATVPRPGALAGRHGQRAAAGGRKASALALSTENATTLNVLAFIRDELRLPTSTGVSVNDHECSVRSELRSLIRPSQRTRERTFWSLSNWPFSPFYSAPGPKLI